MTKSLWPMLAIVTMSLAIPASAQVRDREIPPGGLAQNEAECMAQFNAADRNGNGILSEREVSESRGVLPPSLAGEVDISRQEFLSECNTIARSRREGG